MTKRPKLTDAEFNAWCRRLREEAAWSDFEWACWRLDHPIVIRCRATGRVLRVVT